MIHETPIMNLIISIKTSTVRDFFEYVEIESFNRSEKRHSKLLIIYLKLRQRFTNNGFSNT